jgi:hypothetical protein
VNNPIPKCSVNAGFVRSIFQFHPSESTQKAEKGHTTLTVTTFSIMTLSLTINYAILRINDTQHLASCCLSVIYTECHICSLSCLYCHVKCQYAKCRYAECRGALEWAPLERRKKLLNFKGNFLFEFSVKKCKNFLDEWTNRDEILKPFSFHVIGTQPISISI